MHESLLVEILQASWEILYITFTYFYIELLYFCTIAIRHKNYCQSFQLIIENIKLRNQIFSGGKVLAVET